MKRFDHVALWCAAAILAANVSIATAEGTVLKGTFSFTKKPPITGVVYLPEVKRSMGEAIVVDQKNKQFVENVFVGPKGSEIQLKNSDTIDHNIYANDPDAHVNFDIGLGKPNTVHKQSLDWQDGVAVRIGCKIHPKMRAWVLSVDSAHIETIDFDRKKRVFEFAMKNIPNQASKVEVWLPGYDPIRVEVAANASVEVQLRKRGKLRGTLTLTRDSSTAH